MKVGIVMNEKSLQRYISVCIEDACRTEKCENDVETGYKIIGDQILFAIKSKSARLRRRIETRLNNNMWRNLQLKFHLIYPDALHEHQDCFKASRFDLFGGDSGEIDPNHTIDKWVVFGKEYTIRCLDGNRPLSELGIPHLEKLKANGYDHDKDKDFDKFVEAYKASYRITPLEWYLTDYYATVAKQKIVDNHRKQHDIDELEYGCGYWSVCDESGSSCPCSPSAQVSLGFNEETWNNMRLEVAECLRLDL